MKVTQLITTYNRGNLLDNNFKRLSQLTIPDEILVMDDGGNDNTKEVCNRWEESLPVRYIYNNNPGTSICSLARNIGIKESQHDYIITCEPELVYVTDIIKQLIEVHENHPEDTISAGKVYFAPPNYLLNINKPDPEPGWELADGWVAPYTALWTKEWLEELGGWDEEFPGPWGWDDIDLLTRLRINRHGQHIDKDMVAIHQFHGLGGDHNAINEQHFRSKSFIDKGDESKFGEEELVDLVANRNHEWGKLRT